jgi:serine/threonine protein kinase
MAVVFAAFDRVLKRHVAIKIVRHEALDDPDAPMRLRREARAVGGLRHPNIITFHDVGEHDGRVFIIMERLRGRTLGDERKRCQRIDALRVARIGAQIADALSAAHAVDIIHRDLKPDNVFLIDRAPDFVKLLDFSVAKLPSSLVDGQITSTGAVFGTPNYMPPEQAIGDPVSPRSDLYALGSLLFELCSGKPPYQAKSVIQLLTLQSTEDAPDLRSAEGDAPPELADLVAHLLQRVPANRPSSAAEVERILRSIAERIEREGLAPPPMPRPRRRIEDAEKTQQGAAHDPGSPVAVRAPGAVFRAVHLGADDAPERSHRQTQPATRRAPASAKVVGVVVAAASSIEAAKPAIEHAVPRPRRSAESRSTAPVNTTANAEIDAVAARALASGIAPQRSPRRTQPSWAHRNDATPAGPAADKPDKSA